MKKFAIILLAVALFATMAVASDKPVWEKGDIYTLGALDCSNALPVTCGVLLSGDTTNGSDVVDVYTGEFHMVCVHICKHLDFRADN